MILWFALLIPVIAGIILFTFFKKETTWWEVSVPLIFNIILILMCRLFYEMGSTTDIEYRGQVVTDARFYEYTSTWRQKTCYRTVTTYSGSGKNRRSHSKQVPYDCSYCDETPEHWIVTNNKGQEYSISKQYYEKLIGQWQAKPEFVNLDRSINKRGGCGIDGNAYNIKWNNLPASAESTVTTSTFTNRILASKSAFSYTEIKDEDKLKWQLYNYPEMNNYRQEAILGLDKIPLKHEIKEEIKRKFEYINGLGYKHHGKLFVLLFPNKEIDVAFKQEAFWVGGKDNQLTVCVGYDPTTYKMTWVKAFSWDKDKRAMVDSREDLMEIGNVLQWGTIYNKMYNIMHNHYHPRDFADFDYLEIELPTWLLILIYVLSLILTAGLSYWIVVNEFQNEDAENFKQKRY